MPINLQKCHFDRKGEQMAEETIKTDVVDDPESEKTEESFVEKIKTASPEAAEAIKKLREENAAKRIRAQKAEERVAKLEAELKELAKKNREQEKNLTEKEQKEKEKQLAEAGEIEKLTLKFEEQAKQFNTLWEQLAEKDKLVRELSHKTTIQERQNFVDRLIANKNVAFASGYERDGFMAYLLTQENGEFKFNDDEVVMEVAKLKKAKHVMPETPAGGPVNRGSEAPDSERLKVLLEKSKRGGLLTEKERKELDTIYSRIEDKIV
jgi:hypothetical protein